MPAPTPMIRNQSALSVGAPVKKRETLELAEWYAFIPKIKKITPMTRNATDTFLFISPPFICPQGRFWVID